MTKNKGWKAGLSGLFLLAALLLWCGLVQAVNPYYPVAGKGPAAWSDTAGTTGLTVKYVPCDSCTGTLPSVTINGGVVGHTLSDIGGGQYWKDIPEGCYYVFVSGVSKQKASVVADSSLRWNLVQDANNWVTNARMADNAVGSAEIINGSVTGADMANSTIGSTQVNDGSLLWADFNSSFKGSSPDESFTIEEIQDSLRAVMGNWSPGDYTAGQIDSIVRTIVGSSFSSASVTLVVAGEANGVRSVWTMNTVANYDAVNYYEVYRGDYPYLHAAGSMDSASYANLNGVMTRCAAFFSPPRGVQSLAIQSTDTTYVVVVATDFAGNHVSSGWAVGVPGNIGIGLAVSLAGTPYYLEGNQLTDVLRTISLKVQTLEARSIGETSEQRIIVFQKRVQSASGVDVDAGTLPIDTIKTNGPPKTTGVFTWQKYPDYNTMSIVAESRCKAVGETGTLYLETGSRSLAIPVIYSTGFAMYSGTISVSDFVQDSLYYGYIRGLANAGGDTLITRQIVVTLR